MTAEALHIVDVPKKPAPLWNGREVRFLSVGIGVFRSARMMDREAGMYHVMIHSMVYADDGKRVFNSLEEVDAVPNVDAYKILTLAGRAADTNKPNEADKPPDP